MSDSNIEAILVSLLQVVQVGIKRHFKAARMSEPHTNGIAHTGFDVTVLGQDFEISIKHRGRAK